MKLMTLAARGGRGWTTLGMAAATIATAACSDRTPTAADRRPADDGAPLAALTCAVDVRAESMTCTPTTPGAAPATAASASRSSSAGGGGGGGIRPRPDITVGGQNVYIRIATAGPQTVSLGSVAGPVTVTNLMSQALGAADGTTVMGIKVFFHQLPTVTSGRGTVEVVNPDGYGTFTGTNQPYYFYNQALQPGETSAPKTWQFRLGFDVFQFVFQVYVRAALPNEQGGVLRWTKTYEDADPSAGFGGMLAPGYFGIWQDGSTGQHFVVGSLGTVLKRTSEGWRTVPTGTQSTLTDIWGTATSNLYVVGAMDSVLHWTGGTMWDVQRVSPAGTKLNAVAGWGSGGVGELVAVGEEGRVVRKVSATDWQLEYTAPSGRRLVSVWAGGPNDIWAVGDGGTAIHYDGSAWSPVAVPGVQSFESLTSVWGTGTGHVFIGRYDNITHFDGTTWTNGNIHRFYPTVSFPTAFYKSGTNEVTAVGNYGQIWKWYGSGSDWGFQETASYDDYRDVAGGLAVSTYGYIGPLSSPINHILPPKPLTAISGGTVGTSTVTNYDCETQRFSNGVQRVESFVAGGHFDLAPNGLSLTSGGVSSGKSCAVIHAGSFGGIWSAGTTPASDVYAVGSNGLIDHQVNGTTWTTEPSGTTAALTDVWGASATDVFAVGVNGTIVHRVNGAWTPMTSGTTQTLTAVWGGSATDVYAVGNAGTILHYDGTAWSPMASGTTVNLRDVWAASAREAYAVGPAGTLLQYDGSGWHAIAFTWDGPPPTLNGVWGRGPGEVFVVGDRNVQIRGTR